MTLVSMLVVTLAVDIALTTPNGTNSLPPNQWHEIPQEVLDSLEKPVCPHAEEMYIKYGREDAPPVDIFGDEEVELRFQSIDYQPIDIIKESL